MVLICNNCSDILRRIVVETVASMMVLPNKFPIKLSEEVEAVELKAPEPEVINSIINKTHTKNPIISGSSKGTRLWSQTSDEKGHKCLG